MAKLHDMRLKLLIQQEHERISKSQPNDLDLSIVQARCLCWLALLAEAHEDQANDAEKRKMLIPALCVLTSELLKNIMKDIFNHQ